MAPEVSPKATEVLDRLARQQSSRALFRRVPRIDLPTAREVVQAVEARRAGEEPDTSSATDATHGEERVEIVRRELKGVPGRRVPQGTRWFVAAVLVAALVMAVVLQRRPPPIEQRLPMASAETAVRSVPESGSSLEPGAAGTASTETPAGGGESAAEGPVFVHVAGAVAAPGVVELGPRSRVVDAVRAAGGLRADADPDRVNLAAPIGDGQRVVVPVVGQPPPEEVPLTAAPGDSGGAAAVTSPAGIDVNTASSTELEELPGVGPATAAAIISHREANGPFASVDSLVDVRGIGEAKLEALRDLVVIGGTR